MEWGEAVLLAKNVAYMTLGACSAARWRIIKRPSHYSLSAQLCQTARVTTSRAELPDVVLDQECVHVGGKAESLAVAAEGHDRRPQTGATTGEDQSVEVVSHVRRGFTVPRRRRGRLEFSPGLAVAARPHVRRVRGDRRHSGNLAIAAETDDLVEQHDALVSRTRRPAGR